MDIMTTVRSKQLVDSQASFLVYHFKSLKLVQNSAMNETFIIVCCRSPIMIVSWFAVTSAME